jgi:CheY-like chemotaxis protein
MKDLLRSTTQSSVPSPTRCAADGPETTAPLRAGWPRRLAWLPVPLLLAAMIVGRAAGLRESYENDALRLVLSFTFYFAVRLPLAKEPPSDFEAPVALPTVVCGPLRILLVEDNPANQKLATYILQDRGHLVEVAGDGQEAVYLAAQNRYDVILMDVQMPGMNGLEATDAIRNREAATFPNRSMRKR